MNKMLYAYALYSGGYMALGHDTICAYKIQVALTCRISNDIL